MNFDSPEWDPLKSDLNQAKHGLRFEEFRRFDAPPTVIVDDRREYGEPRYRAFGKIGGRGYMIAFTTRGGRVRLISFRRVHIKEMQRYAR